MGNFNFQVIHIKTNFIAPFYGWGLNASRLQSHYEDAVTVISFNKKTTCSFIDAIHKI